MKKTAIVIDDEPDIVEIFSDLLEERGVDIVAKGYNGKEAIDLYIANQPDIVFIDIMMPDGSGFHAIKKIRDKNKKACLIAVTADNRNATEEKLKSLKINAIVYKPVDMEEVMKIINTQESK